ncbi:MAG: hypothetical protein IEMM0008_1444 [bacterium]|nr:MAG: hypothetical protein IEMM0008_1444 [bacterium]
MTQKERTGLIREGNKLFNEGDKQSAQKYFLKADYQSGLLRVADYYFYDKQLPLNALPLYMKCGAKSKIEEIHQRMAFALEKLLGNDKDDETQDENDIELTETDGKMTFQSTENQVEKSITQALEETKASDHPDPSNNT